MAMELVTEVGWRVCMVERWFRKEGKPVGIGIWGMREDLGMVILGLMWYLM